MNDWINGESVFDESDYQGAIFCDMGMGQNACQIE